MRKLLRLVSSNLIIRHLTHEITPFNIFEASYRLYQAINYWPAGTVFVSVVDPGVGTTRRAVVAKTENEHYIVTPDNGILDVINKTEKIVESRVIDQTINRYHGNEWSEKSDIFHGRDVFAFCGAKLAAGQISFEEVGEAYPLEEIVKL